MKTVYKLKFNNNEYYHSDSNCLSENYDTVYSCKDATPICLDDLSYPVADNIPSSAKIIVILESDDLSIIVGEVSLNFVRMAVTREQLTKLRRKLAKMTEGDDNE